MRKKIVFKSPFLKKISSEPDNFDETFPYPRNIPSFCNGIDISINNPVTFFVGENGSGKSTLLEAIADKCGFNLTGGSQHHYYGSDQPQREAALSKLLRLSWMPKVKNGLFMRAESYFNFATYIDEISKENQAILDAYGGKSLHGQSHGESFLSLFQARLGGGIYILDEPEAALSPSRQLTFLSLIHNLTREGDTQFLLSSHSPILLSYPGADIFQLNEGGITSISWKDTDHYILTKEFLNDPNRYFRYLFAD